MDIFTKGALWDYWKMGSDEIEPTNDESSNLEETDHDDEQEIGEIFRIETNLFNYETPLCKEFKEFNYARQWWINEGEGKITTWKELVEKFFCKFYPESYDGEEEMLDEGNNWGIDPLEFISRVNSSFNNHMRVDGRTKKDLAESKEIDEVGEVSIIWNLMCDCSHASIQTHLQHTFLLINSTWRIYRAKYQGSFSF
ncbi:hypothetical protein Tco_1171506 [Tanacetum coccineum]